MRPRKSSVRDENKRTRAQSERNDKEGERKRGRRKLYHRGD